MFLLSAILIYLVLAAQFESFRDPFIILAGSVPLAISGALLFSFLRLTTLNIYSQVGLITLVGLVSKNGILIVQFANHLQETGKDKLAAIIEAAGTRLRPILMTTAATVVGHFPLVIRDRSRRRRAQQHRHHARERHDHRHAVHAVRRAVDLHAAGAEARGRRGAKTMCCRTSSRGAHRKERQHDWNGLDQSLVDHRDRVAWRRLPVVSGPLTCSRNRTTDYRISARIPLLPCPVSLHLPR